MNPWVGTSTIAELLLNAFEAGKTEWCAKNAKYVSHQDELIAELWDLDHRILYDVALVNTVPF